MKVSVSLITYNHEPYIVQALEGALMQQTDFDYEVVVGEDSSTDRTREIVLAFQERHPEKLRLLPSEGNLGMMANFLRTLQACTGEYIALLDGDDYWSSPEKLQKQVGFLEAHPECSVCFHNVVVIYEDTNLERHPFHLPAPIHALSRRVPKPVSTLADLVRGNFLQTCSVMYRAGLFGDPPAWLYQSALGDWPLHVLNAQHGDIGYLDEVLGVYRVHSGGVWSSNLSHMDSLHKIEGLIELYQAIDRHLDFRYQTEIQQQLKHLYYSAMQLLYATESYSQAGSYASKYLALLPLRDRLQQPWLPKLLLARYFPRAYRFMRDLRLIGRREHMHEQPFCTGDVTWRELAVISSSAEVEGRCRRLAPPSE